MMKYVVLLPTLFLTLLALGQSAFNVGEIIDSIPVADSNIENFALYLPSNYSSEKLSSIVFIFEPAGRGKVGISPFLIASEKYGVILVCSNNSKNGPYDRNFIIASRLFDYVFSQFAINNEQVFLSGFSGGSRIAASIASLSDGIAGVIGCGAGFSLQPAHMPYEAEFLYAGICGNRDMNYIEMLDLMPFLERLKFHKTLFTYDAAHRWPPDEKIVESFDWLFVELHKKGVVTLEEKQLKNLYVSGYDKAERKLKNGDALLAVEDFNRLRQNFGSIYDLDSVTAKIKTIRNQPAFRIGSKEKSKAIAYERKLTTVYFERIKSEYVNPEALNLDWWKKAFKKLKKQYDKGGEETKKMIHRLRYKIFASLSERTNPNINPKSTQKQREYSKKIITLLKVTMLQ
ncbi:hypothetical protein [Maribacter aestuarii]|uniref:hypothetical protein n=1 Tax=Maribacter aestuarii TaxID=1130723 RepID=UPI00248C3224|nr:hypothetical protein [Maribacter aestuarii]